jgi:hypothetical protein
MLASINLGLVYRNKPYNKRKWKQILFNKYHLVVAMQHEHMGH